MADIGVEYGRVAQVEELEPFQDEYVYDIGVASDRPFFFANDILVHNSVYFSAVPVLQRNEELRHILEDRSTVVDLYDSIGEKVNDSFPAFMDAAFNCGMERGAIIKAGRELVAGRGLFITKKRYALLVYDKEGTRLDVGGKPGKIKAVGLDLKRADTPKIMQEFLESVLTDLLTGKTEDDIIQKIIDFRSEFRKLDDWAKGTPKKVNGITGFVNKINDNNKKNTLRGDTLDRLTIPGHVQASINWNKLRAMNSDNYSMEIQDGQKVVVCKLKSNPLRMTSIAYPYDENHLPDWFKKLPFDQDEMEATIIDKKLENLFSVLKWDLARSKNNTTFEDLFSF